MKKFLSAMVLCMVFLTGFNPAEAIISDYGRQVTEEFLSEFTSLFSFGRRERDGEIVSRIRSGRGIPGYIVDYRPHIFYESGRVLGRDGNRVDNAVFTRFGLYARNLLMFDLDNDGIPEIFIMWMLPQAHGGVPTADRWTLYVYDNGTFRDSGKLFQATLLDFYYNSEGQILMTEIRYIPHQSSVSYSYVTIEGGNFYTRSAWSSPVPHDIRELTVGGCNARNHHLSAEFAANPTRFDTGEPLMNIPNLNEFDALITESIRAWLYAPNYAPVPLFREPDPGIRVRFNGRFINLQGQQPEIINGRTLVPLRAVMEALGFNVYWNEENKFAYVTKDGLTVIIQTDSYDMEIKGYDTVSLDVPSRNINGRIMIPVRAIAEISGMSVEWNNANREVVILSGIEQGRVYSNFTFGSRCLC